MSPVRVFTVTLALTLLALMACTTASGPLNEQVVRLEKAVAEQKEQGQQEGSEEPEGAEEPQDGGEEQEDQQQEEDGDAPTGIRIVTDPANARVYLNHRYIGQSPLLVAEVEPGRYRLTIAKEGFREHSVWVNYESGVLVYEALLEQITGFLLVKTAPDQAQVIVGGTVLSSNFQELPVGRYTLLVRAFGYEEHHSSVVIREDQLREIAVVLEEAVFRLSEIAVTRVAFNPQNPGILGTCRFSFQVTSYGQGEVIITASDGSEVFTDRLPSFRTWDQTFVWDGRINGSPLPDGTYTVTVVAQSERTGEVIEQATVVSINSSLRIQYRNLWCGGAGLLYAYAIDQLPPGSFQLSAFSVGHRVADTYRIPTTVALRVGLAEGVELDATGGIILENTGLVPLYGSVSTTLRIYDGLPSGALRVAASAKIAIQNDMPTDLLANFAGIAAGLPIQLTLGRFNLLYTPEIILSPWDILYDPTAVERATGAYVRLYQRAGVLFDLGFLASGISVSMRSDSLTESLSLFEPPLQAAFELNWLIPKTQLYVSFALTGEFAAIDNYYLLAGGGMGFIY